MTYSLTLEGMGALVDLLNDPVAPDTMPDGASSLSALTVVSVAGTTAGSTAVYVNPAKEKREGQYFYKLGEASLTYPSYGETMAAATWDGTAEIEATNGQEIMIIEADSSGRAIKAGIATVTAA